MSKTCIAEDALPRISIITVVLNDAEGIAVTLKSVQSQGYPPFEHIIVDEGSTDRTIAVTEANKNAATTVISVSRALRITMVSVKNTGSTAAYTRCSGLRRWQVILSRKNMVAISA